MAAIFRTVPKDAYDRWVLTIADDKNIPLIDLGKQVAMRKGCGQCHTVAGRDRCRVTRSLYRSVSHSVITTRGSSHPTGGQFVLTLSSHQISGVPAEGAYSS